MNLYVHKINKATSQWYHRLSERYRIGNSICQQVIEGTLSLHIAPIPLTSLNSSVQESSGCIKKNHSISKCFNSAAIHCLNFTSDIYAIHVWIGLPVILKFVTWCHVLSKSSKVICHIGDMIQPPENVHFLTGCRGSWRLLAVAKGLQKSFCTKRLRLIVLVINILPHLPVISL